MLVTIGTVSSFSSSLGTVRLSAFDLEYSPYALVPLSVSVPNCFAQYSKQSCCAERKARAVICLFNANNESESPFLTEPWAHATNVHVCIHIDTHTHARAHTHIHTHKKQSWVQEAASRDLYMPQREGAPHALSLQYTTQFINKRKQMSLK